MKTTVQRISLPDQKRILMLSDPHGHADELRAILQKARFTPDDVLFIVGDLIEKGPKSLETLRLVMDLCRSHTVIPLMGNVDLWRIEQLDSDDPGVLADFRRSSLQNARSDWWGSSLLSEMCREMGDPLAENTDMSALMPALRRHFEKELNFLRSLPTIVETQRFIFVHGGVPHEDLDALEGTDAYPLLKFDDFYSAGLSFQKYVVAGHWPAVLYSKTYPVFDPLIDRRRRIISLDGACGVKTEGQLNLLMLSHWQSDDFSLLTCDSLPRIRALEAQAPSSGEQARYIRWNDHAVTLLEKGEEMSRVLYHGAPMDVPTQFVFDHGGVLSCSDVTDYVLPVQPEDELKLILRLSHGCYVKKNSVAGWYLGRYETIEKEG